MKICHITSAHNRTDARVFKRECSSLAKSGNEVTLVCCDGKPDEVLNDVTITSFSKTKFSKKERRSLLFKNRSFVSFLKKIDADIYQFHDIELIEVGRKLAKTRKVIFDSHEDWKAYLSGLVPNIKWMQRIYEYVFDAYYRRNLKKFSAVFTVSPNFVRNLKTFTPKVYMVPNYPALNSLSTPLEKSELKNDFVYAGTVYSFSNQKNIVRAINSVIQKYETKYKIVGKISETIKNDILDVDKSHCVEFVDWVPKSELEAILNTSRAGIVVFDYVPICANKEGQMGSNKIFEYMAAGLPIICTDFTLWKELIVDKYKCGICVSPSNPDEIASAMEFILSNPEEARAMGARGRRAVLDEFNWDKSEKEFINLYQMILNNKSNE